MAARVICLLTLCLALAGSAGAGAAHAQSDPFGPVAPAPQPPPEPPPPPPDDDDGLNRTQELLIGGAGIVLLFGIGWAIVRDARSAAPVDRARPPGMDDERGKATRVPKQRRVRQGRAKAKAARRARKKNR